jgi:hypothetical protein
VPHHSCPCLLPCRSSSQYLIIFVFLCAPPLPSVSRCAYSHRFASGRGGVWLRKGSVVSSRACSYDIVFGLFICMVLVCRFASRLIDAFCSSCDRRWCVVSRSLPLFGFILVSLRGHSYSHRTPREGVNPSSRWLLPSASAPRARRERDHVYSVPT